MRAGEAEGEEAMAELKRYQMLIDGEWVDGEGAKTFESVNPATAAAWAEIPEASEADVDRWWRWEKRRTTPSSSRSGSNECCDRHMTRP